MDTGLPPSLDAGNEMLAAICFARARPCRGLGIGFMLEIVQVQGWGPGGPLYCLLHYSVCLKISVIKIPKSKKGEKSQQLISPYGFCPERIDKCFALSHSNNN